MPLRQATTITELVARRLGLDFDTVEWMRAARRAAVAPASAVQLADHVGEVGRSAGIAYLTRRVPRDRAAALAAEGAFPAVLVAEREPGRLEAFVLLGVGGAQVDVAQVGMDGAVVELSVLRAELPAAIAARTGGAAELIALLPLAVGAAEGRVAAQRGEGEIVDADEDGRADEEPTPTSRLWALLVRERRDIYLIYLYAMLAGLFSLTLPLSVQAIVGLVSGGLILQPVVLLIAFVVAGTLAAGLLQLLQLSVVETIQQRVFARMALDFSFRLPRIRYEAALREDVPELMNRFFESVTIQKSLSKLLVDVSTALLTIVFGLVLLTFYHPYFTLFGLTLIAGIVLIFWLTGPKGMATSLAESKYKYKAVHWLQEMARALTAFKFAGRTALPVERMDELVTGYLKHRKGHFRVLVQQTLSVIAFKTLVTGGLLVLGSVLVIDRQITLGQFVASEIVIVTVLNGIEKLVLSIETVYDILTSVEKAGHVTDLPLEPTGGRLLPSAAGGMAIELRDAGLRYPGADGDALARVTLTVRPGERIAVTGYDGAGQTTLLKLVSGLFDHYHGAISYDGVTLRDLDRVALRAQVGQMLSWTDLFEGTIEENVAVGRPHVHTGAVTEALELVGINEEVQALPLGLRTPIAQGGAGLPSNVVSKLLVAQGIAGNPRLVVFDDFFQNLEPEYRQHLVALLTDRAREWTVVAVSHDPAFLAACDRVVVMREGRVHRVGAYEELAGEMATLVRPRSGGSGAPAGGPGSGTNGKGAGGDDAIHG